MKNLISLTMIAAITLTNPVNAQEYSGCFALDAQGNYTDLNYLCNIPSSNQTGTRSTGSTGLELTSPTKKQSNDDIFEGIFYDSFCTARKAGYSLDSANEYAMNESFDMIAVLGDIYQRPLVSANATQTSVDVATGKIPCPLD